MENQQKKFITRIFEFIGLFALSLLLLRLGVSYILEIWPVLVILAVVIVGIVVGYRIWKNKAGW